MRPIHIQSRPKSPSKAFALESPLHLLSKLHWEVHQLRSSLKTTQPVGLLHVPAYHAFNCAITSWHLSDWTWEYIDDKTKQLVSEQLSKPLETLEHFQRALRKKHRTLHLCWQLCNGSKHFRLKRVDDVEIETQSVWQHHPPMAGSLQAGQSVESHQYTLSVTDQGKRLQALQLFENAGSIWCDELASWFVIEGRFIDESTE